MTYPAQHQDGSHAPEGVPDHAHHIAKAQARARALARTVAPNDLRLTDLQAGHLHRHLHTLGGSGVAASMDGRHVVGLQGALSIDFDIVRRELAMLTDTDVVTHALRVIRTWIEIDARLDREGRRILALRGRAVTPEAYAGNPKLELGAALL